MPDPLLLRACSVHAGGRYRNRKDSATPPSDGWEVSRGRAAPAPVVLAGSALTLSHAHDFAPAPAHAGDVGVIDGRVG